MDNFTPEARALLELATSADGPPVGAKARVLARVQAAVQAPPSAAVLEAERLLMGRPLPTNLLPLAGGGLVLGVLAAGLYLNSTPATDIEARLSPLAVRSFPSFSEARVVTSEDAEAASEPAESAGPPKASSRPVRRRLRDLRPPLAVAPPVDAAVASSAPPPRPTSSLAEEAGLLSAARASLRDGRFDEALAQTDAHAERFPSGVLRRERFAAQALALCGLDRFTEAQAAAASLRAEDPASPYLERISAACRR